MYENVDRIMEDPQVSGEIQMSSVMFGALNEALSHLTKRNRDKFAYKSRQHFYGDYTVKMFFAELIANLILFTKVIAPNQYYKVVDEPRRQRAIKSALENLDNNTVWDNNKKTFVLATAAQVEKTKAARHQKLLDVYNVTN